jgi:hypothetical protein
MFFSTTIKLVWSYSNALKTVIRIRMFLGLNDPDQDPYRVIIYTDPDPSINKQKKLR